MKQHKVVFIHPDLGIGGAERWLVDAAMAVLQKGHDVKIYTASWDPNRCFPETKDGSLKIVKPPFMIIPRTIFGKFQAICALVRCFLLTIWLLFVEPTPDVVIVDAVSSPLVLLTLFGIPSLFYCHFPDLLLAKRENRSCLYHSYRRWMDKMEEYTLSLAQRIVVNSHFTAQVFQDTFPELAKKSAIAVLYPCIAVEPYVRLDSLSSTTIVSLNRFETKKHVDLLIHAIAYIRDTQKLTNEQWIDLVVVIAGGYDTRVDENVTCLQHLRSLVEHLDLTSKVEFLLNISDEERRSLLSSCKMVVYTPIDEHFGIVPLEAMAMKKPVIAHNSGGPKETIIDGETGLLCEDSPEVGCTLL
ncbi:alpha-1,3/alpha-1,6-mannosyltransferase [Galdieria sulphuraria]|uniref:Alpha-1,3/1,6-mannosyltransferase ALG2 n=1 Tax=Galdieria sulphuraria TaxID=130081 RepID=M2XT59_GALSU|nr:alpha-1,3/alpha-1,6-mannosyltransferase [Galdieria sulphuraria]EME26629.1 alpha-1,3/alpha-1,6-mannosyltransferase [Galdieria sulphuraria]|eukprot:XP_005703149.1 alpha-1,3/alpha-1,6-mannosyltransferase [Galdieria sulphuraria]